MEYLSIFRIIYFLGAINALFFSILIFSKHQKSLADKILAWWLIVLSMQVLYPFLYLTNIPKYQQFMGYEASLSVLHPAGLFFYTKAMVGKLKLELKTYVIIVLLLISSASIFGFMSYMPEERIVIFDEHNFLRYFDFKGKILVFIFSALIIGLYAYFLARSNKLLKEYKQKVLDVFSNSDKIDLQWLRKLILFFYACYALTILASMVIYFGDISLAFTDYFYYFMMVVFVFLIGYWGHQQGSVFNLEKAKRIEIEAISHEKSPTPLKNNGKSMGKEAIELRKMMEDEKPYLEPMLTINDLATRLDMPAHQLSKLIHNEFGKNFYEFINHYRIESFKTKVTSHQYQNLTLLAIAFECGFNSKSAFNRIFKEQTGLTPRDYKLQAKSNIYS